jgi:hypothetical protein
MNTETIQEGYKDQLVIVIALLAILMTLAYVLTQRGQSPTE